MMLYEVDLEAIKALGFNAAFERDELVKARVLVPVKPSAEYRLVATKPGGGLKRWCFAKEKTARKHLADLETDIVERPLCGYTDPYLEVRQVTEWTPTNGAANE